MPLLAFIFPIIIFAEHMQRSLSRRLERYAEPSMLGGLHHLLAWPDWTRPFIILAVTRRGELRSQQAIPLGRDKQPDHTPRPICTGCLDLLSAVLSGASKMHRAAPSTKRPPLGVRCLSSPLFLILSHTYNTPPPTTASGQYLRGGSRGVTDKTKTKYTRPLSSMNGLLAHQHR